MTKLLFRRYFDIIFHFLDFGLFLGIFLFFLLHSLWVRSPSVSVRDSLDVVFLATFLVSVAEKKKKKGCFTVWGMFLYLRACLFIYLLWSFCFFPLFPGWGPAVFPAQAGRGVLWFKVRVVNKRKKKEKVVFFVLLGFFSIDATKSWLAPFFPPCILFHGFCFRLTRRHLRLFWGGSYRLPTTYRKSPGAMNHNLVLWRYYGCESALYSVYKWSLLSVCAFFAPFFVSAFTSTLRGGFKTNTSRLKSLCSCRRVPCLKCA